MHWTICTNIYSKGVKNKRINKMEITEKLNRKVNKSCSVDNQYSNKSDLFFSFCAVIVILILTSCVCNCERMHHKRNKAQQKQQHGGKLEKNKSIN